MRTEKLPWFGLRGSIVKPGETIEINIGRDTSVSAIKHAIQNFSGKIVVLTQRQVEENNPRTKEDFFPHGIICIIDQSMAFPDGSMKIMITGEIIIRIENFYVNTDVQMAEIAYVEQSTRSAEHYRPFENSINSRFDLEGLLFALYHEDESSGVDAVKLVRFNQEVKKLHNLLISY